MLTTTASAFGPSAVRSRAYSTTKTALKGKLANGAMDFDAVCREWRCKYEGDKATSKSLEEIAGVVNEYLPAIKGVSADITVNRLVCGSCLDFSK